MLWILLGAVLMVLLVAGANVANLVLVRAEAQRQALAVQLALGAGSGRIAWRDPRRESLLLSGASGVRRVALA